MHTFIFEMYHISINFNIEFKKFTKLYIYFPLDLLDNLILLYHIYRERALQVLLPTKN